MLGLAIWIVYGSGPEPPTERVACDESYMIWHTLVVYGTLMVCLRQILRGFSWVRAVAVPGVCNNSPWAAIACRLV